MHYVVRKDEILEMLERYDYVTVNFLADALHISPSSIRRDLVVLESQGLLKRSHGGASRIGSSNTLSPYSLRMHQNSTQKRQICKKAVQLVSDGDVIFIDGSTTCLFLPELLEDKNDITVLTNSLRIAAMFKNNVRVYCTGGSVRLGDENVAFGPIAEETCRKIHTDLMFFSARAIDENGTITDLNEPETALRQVAMENTQKAVFLCDSTKIGEKSVFKVCQAQDLFCVVMDEMPAAEILQKWNAKNVL